MSQKSTGIFNTIMEKMRKIAIFVGLGSLFGVAAGSHIAAGAHGAAAHGAAAQATPPVDGSHALGVDHAADMSQPVHQTPIDQGARADWIAQQKEAAVLAAQDPASKSAYGLAR